MARSDDVLLDLSAWKGDRDAGDRRTTLPPRPSRRGRRPVPVRGLAVGAGVVGLALLVLPLPGSGCGSPLAVWRDSPAALPVGTGPALDDAQVAADAEAVRRAQLALAAPVSAPAARTSPVPVTRTVVQPGSSEAAARVPALEQAVAQDEQDVAAAKAARDDVVEQQQAAEDPNSYDTEVAAAQEDLDAAEARLAGDRAALEEARRRARSSTVTVTTTSPAPAPAASSTDASGPSRAERAEALAAARRTQAEHLAERREALGAWTAQHAAEVTQVQAANARLRSCERGARVPAGLGALALAGAAGAALRLRRAG